jgi:hypothetical protein
MSLGPGEDKGTGGEAGQPPGLQDAAPGELDLVAPQVADQEVGLRSAQARPQLPQGGPL